MRSQQKLLPIVEGYKAFNNDLTCRNFQFEIGKRHKLPNNGPLELCKNGFHFCPQPSGVWAYYYEGRVFKIRAYGVLDSPFEAGADFKMVCEEIELVEEMKIGGDCNTGNGNTGDYNTGDCNTGNRNTGTYNTGDCNAGNHNTGTDNTGDYNTGDCNTGNRNTGDYNTGHGNTGTYNAGNDNTGHYNTGNRNTGDCNCGDYHSGSLNCKEAPIYLFDKITKVKREDIPWHLVKELSQLVQKDADINPGKFLVIPNATVKGIKKLHEAHKAARKR